MSHSFREVPESFAQWHWLSSVRLEGEFIASRGKYRGRALTRGRASVKLGPHNITNELPQFGIR